MTTLADFLLARVTEDEAAARRMIDNEAWVADCNEPHDARIELWDRGAMTRTWLLDGRRVLTECEAKRRIAEMHQPEECWSDVPTECGQCSFHEAHEGFNDEHEPWPCLTLRLLAMPYADHPDYRQEWKP